MAITIPNIGLIPIVKTIPNTNKLSALTNILKAIEKSGGDDLLLERLSALKEEKKELENELNQGDLSMPTDDMEIKRFKTKFAKFLINSDVPEVREFLKTVIVSITLDNDAVDVRLEV